MLNIVSLMIGLVALGLAIFAFLPFLGWANWAIIPLAMVGLGLGFLSGKDAGRNLNLIVIVVGVWSTVPTPIVAVEATGLAVRMNSATPFGVTAPARR